MPEVQSSITINRPVSEVFRTTINFEEAHKWQKDVTESHQTEDSIRVGVMVSQRRTTRLLGWKLDLNADIVDYMPNRLLGYKGVLGRFPFSGRMEFESLGGTTKVTQKLDIRMGFLYSIFSPLMRGVMTRRTNQSLQALKTLLETRSGASTATDFHKQL